MPGAGPLNGPGQRCALNPLPLCGSRLSWTLRGDLAQLDAFEFHGGGGVQRLDIYGAPPDTSMAEAFTVLSPRRRQRRQGHPDLGRPTAAPLPADDDSDRRTTLLTTGGTTPRLRPTTSTPSKCSGARSRALTGQPLPRHHRPSTASRARGLGSVGTDYDLCYAFLAHIGLDHDHVPPNCRNLFKRSNRCTARAPCCGAHPHGRLLSVRIARDQHGACCGLEDRIHPSPRLVTRGALDADSPSVTSARWWLGEAHDSMQKPIGPQSIRHSSMGAGVRHRAVTGARRA